MKAIRVAIRKNETTKMVDFINLQNRDNPHIVTFLTSSTEFILVTDDPGITAAMSLIRTVFEDFSWEQIK